MWCIEFVSRYNVLNSPFSIIICDEQRRIDESNMNIDLDESQPYAHSLIAIHLCIEMRLENRKNNKNTHKQDHCSDFLRILTALISSLSFTSQYILYVHNFCSFEATITTTTTSTKKSAHEVFVTRSYYKCLV